jgi:MFS family permease
MFTWGLISASMALVNSEISFYIVRFLLGAAEAGFFPGMILYLSYWFPGRERAKAVGFFMSAIAISYAIGAPISGLVMSIFDGVAGLSDWQWLFIIEAIPALIATGFVLWWFDDGPEDAGVAARRREALAGRAARERGGGPPHARAAHGRRGAQGSARARVRRPLLLHGRQRLRHLVLGRRDR